MCRDVKVQKIKWNRSFKQRVPVGYIDKENHYILLSDEVDPSGCYHDIWIPTDDGIPYIIDILTRRNGRWYYTR
jgi:hypothetical protein